MKPSSLLAPVLALAPASAMAGSISIDLPRLSVAEYHRPYVAIWIEGAGIQPRTLAVWYDADHRGDPGTKWLSDLRGWWRVAGRNIGTPPSGISGATRAPGHHTIPLPADLKPGAYTLKVEAARETGGRELVSIPFTLPRTGGKGAGNGATGEIGAVAVTFP
ncbi:DUF2271 domain-containing protein [Novosphingobium humi]|uniref:DUF2271 domain-containing protein n=1 Tax=Novosphingobium humi TaxID=2282397 RepID=UPI0025AF8E7A|nr:DUF2271 domain-containing protein [Novosphingobium humi]WJS97171.1 DUF2271 domain-containing protein [Novosphingobium humi]